MIEGSSKKYFEKLVTLISHLNHAEIDHGVQLIKTTWESGGQIITFGNGGSSLTAQHFVTDWNKSIFLSTGKPFLGRCLVENMGLVIAYANDMKFENIFIEQLKSLLRPKDLVIGISGSGNSENVIRGMEYANANGAITLGISGYDGGRLKKIAQNNIWVNIHDMQLAEDIHAIFGHIVMQRLCGYLK